jgi:hypothetical protein
MRGDGHSDIVFQRERDASHGVSLGRIQAHWIQFSFARSASTDSTPGGNFASSINITGIPSRTG